jgi:wobble nucleotide-excising tRNase
MLTKLSSIKGTDAFDTFEWNGDSLKRFNVVYGWNGSGKTTISRLLTLLEKRSIHLPELSAIQFSLSTELGGPVTERDLTGHPIEIKVFSKDFVHDNLAFDDGLAKRIVILGEANIQLQRDIELLQAEHTTASTDISTLDTTLGKASRQSDTALTDAGREVTKQFGNTPLASDTYYGRSYNRTRVEARLAEGGITGATLDAFILDQSTLDTSRENIKIERQPLATPAAAIAPFADLFAVALSLLKTRPQVTDRNDLLADPARREWTEVGYHLHRERSATSCLFCDGSLPTSVLDQLAGFFTDELETLKKSIDATVGAVDKLIAICPASGAEETGLFPDLVLEHTTARSIIEVARKAVIANLDSLRQALTRKRANAHEVGDHLGSDLAYPAQSVDGMNTALQAVADVIGAHNRRVSEGDEERRAAAQRVECHAIASALKARDYFAAKITVDDCTAKRATLKARLTEVDHDLKVKQAALHDAQIAIDKINVLLADFFGESQLYLEGADLSTPTGGYSLRSRGKAARHLSEGEKSVLALIYFLIKLDEAGCDKSNCVVVIDDPVDSQDSVFLFRTFGLLSRQLGDVGQVVVLTHNFEFFNLLRDWLVGPSKRDESALFMIAMDKTTGRRHVAITDLPRLLKEHKSEYQYLFSRLYQHVNGGGKLDEPLVANVGRKVLEYFAGFKWSCRTTEQFTSIVLNRFVSAQDRLKSGTGDFIVKFLHEYSHGQDFSRPVSASMFEADSVAKNILAFIRFADKEHFDDLASMC